MQRELRNCCACKQSLPPESFAFKSKTSGTRHSRCKECQRLYARQHYHENRPAYLAKAKLSNARTRELKREIRDAYKARPCADCGHTFPVACMEFDHRNGNKAPDGSYNRANTIAMMVQSCNVSPSTLLAEIDKCDVVCANCHNIRTHARRESKWRDTPSLVGTQH